MKDTGQLALIMLLIPPNTRRVLPEIGLIQPGIAKRDSPLLILTFGLKTKLIAMTPLLVMSARLRTPLRRLPRPFPGVFQLFGQFLFSALYRALGLDGVLDEPF